MSMTARRMQMAASNAGAAGIEFIGKAQNYSMNGGNVSVILPSGTQSGDMMIVSQAESGYYSMLSSMSLSGSGWTTLNQIYQNSTSDINLKTHYKTVASEANIVGLYDSSYTGAATGLQVMVFRNVSSVSSASSGGVNSNSINWPTLSLTSGSAYVYNAALADRYNFMNPPSVADLEQFQSFLRTETYDLYQGQAYKIATANESFDATTWIWSGVYDYRRVGAAYSVLRLDP